MPLVLYLKGHQHAQSHLGSCVFSKSSHYDFTLEAMIYFELTFVKSSRCVSHLLFMQVGVQLFQDHLLKRLPLLHCAAFSQRPVDCVKFISGIPFCSIDLSV